MIARDGVSNISELHVGRAGSPSCRTKAVHGEVFATSVICKQGAKRARRAAAPADKQWKQAAALVVTCAASLLPVVKFHRLARRYFRFLMRPQLNGRTLGGQVRR